MLYLQYHQLKKVCEVKYENLFERLDFITVLKTFGESLFLNWFRVIFFQPTMWRVIKSFTFNFSHMTYLMSQAYTTSWANICLHSSGPTLRIMRLGAAQKKIRPSILIKKNYWKLLIKLLYLIFSNKSCSIDNMVNPFNFSSDTLIKILYIYNLHVKRKKYIKIKYS